MHDYLGTPTQAYDSKGELVWEMLLDVYGKVAECHGDRTLVPFRYQGQYEDEDTGLYYNRFRYYNCNTGSYISQDPIGLAGGNPTLYGYVFDPNIQIDPLGLDCSYGTKKKKKNEKFYRYFSEGEYEVIKRTGKIPNTDAAGNLKKVYYTNRKYVTAGRAKTHNQLPSKPKYRVEIDPANIPDHKAFTKINPEDNPQWGIGGGVESTTSNSIPVDISTITKLEGG